MLIIDAEICFKKGLVALDRHMPEKAAALFHSAIRIEKEQGVAWPQMRYLSYRGLSMARAQGATREAIDACETAARRDILNPDLLLNLGRVYLLAGEVTRALATFAKGLEVAPEHRRLRAELARADRRQRPPISSQPASHPLNVWLGRLRASLRARISRWMLSPQELK